jgi:thioredoxin-like negative regulator of GroEL
MLVEHCRAPSQSALVTSEIVAQLVGIDAWPAIRAIMADNSLDPDKRLVAAQVLASLKNDDKALEFLISLAANAAVGEDTQ